MIRSKDGSSGIVSGLGSLFSKNNILDLNKGVCYYLKDNLCSRDFVTTSSSNFLNDFWPGYDSFVIKLLKKKGYILLGKTILDEFSCGGTGLLANNGVLYHPTNPDHIIGGSSSGSALVVKKGFVSFSLASDTGGSIRIPAAYCGLLGFKPGYGFVSRQGLIPYCSFLDTVGILSSDLETLRKISTILGEEADSGDLWTVLTKKKKINNVVTTPPKKKIVVIKGISQYLSQEYSHIYYKFLDYLKGKGYEITPIAIPLFIRENLLISWISICFSELVSNLNSLQGVTFGIKDNKKTVKQKRTEYLGITVKRRLLIGSFFLKDEEKMLKVYYWRQKLENWINSLFKNNTFLLFPTTISEAPLVSKSTIFSLGNDEHWSSNLALLSNLSRIPSINVPLGLVNKLPVGICVNAKPQEENRIFELAKEILAFTK